MFFDSPKCYRVHVENDADVVFACAYCCSLDRNDCPIPRLGRLVERCSGRRASSISGFALLAGRMGDMEDASFFLAVSLVLIVGIQLSRLISRLIGKYPI